MTDGAAPVLIGCAHGTRGAAGRRAVGSLVAAVRAARPDLQVRAGYVDVHPPAVATVVGAVTDLGGTAVVVPLLLSAGFHVGVDIAAAVAGRPAVAAPALGPDPGLTDLLLDRLREAGLTDRDAVVIAAAGSSNPCAAIAVAAVADAVRQAHPGPVTVGYGASATPTVPDAVRAARAAHPARRVLVAAYLLAPGFFHDRLGRAGADAVSAPLLGPTGPDPRLISLVLERYEAARAGAQAFPRLVPVLAAENRNQARKPEPGAEAGSGSGVTG
jgi:sirohydrochlorin ferrochelatase